MNRPEKIASRKTAQDSVVQLWSDGSLTWALGRYIDGSPHPRTPEQVERALRAGWMVMGEVELHDDAEVSDLIAACRWAADRGLDPGAARARLHRPAVLRPVWQVVEADRDGRPLVRVWRLPRLRWPGLAAWNDRGTYSIWSEVGRTGTYEPTGVEFKNLRDLSKFLLEQETPSHQETKS